MSLTQKEKMLLQDQKNHEELCVVKYNTYAKQAQDPELKQLLSSIEQKEQQHLNTINSILAGQNPSMQQSQQSGQQSSPQTSFQSGSGSESDAILCNDLLATEKYISSTYDTAIFEFKDHNIRQALNHIQKDEQEHGESIFNYMQSKGMYNPQ